MSGCQTNRHPEPVKSALPELVEKYSGRDGNGDPNELDYNKVFSILPISVRSAYDKADDDAKRQRIRNAVMTDFLTLGRAVHRELDERLYRARGGLDTSLDIAGITSSALATILTDPATRTALSGASTLFQGSKDAVSKNFFFEQATDAVIAKMQEKRAAQELVIRNGMLKTATEYPIETALADSIAFLYAGGIAESLAELAGDAEIAKLRQEAVVQEVKVTGVKISQYNASPEAKKLRDEIFILIGGSSQTAITNKEKLATWLSTRGITTPPLIWMQSASNDDLTAALNQIRG